VVEETDMRIDLAALLVAMVCGSVACGDGTAKSSDDRDRENDEEAVKGEAKPSKGEDGKEPSQSDDEDASGPCGTSCERDAGTVRDAGSGASVDAGALDAGARDGSATMDSGRDAASDASTASVDASGVATSDAGRDGSVDTGAAICSTAGQSCEQASCCAGSICVIAPETGSSVCAAQCTAPSQCNSNCCVPIQGGNTNACVPATHCSVPMGPVGGGCGPLQLIAEDGTYLGDATSNTVAANSVCNRVGVHGSAVAAASIYNSVGSYGSRVSTQSAYSTITTTPPAILCSNSGDIVAFVTKSQIVVGAPRIDPDALCVVLANAGL
jgi:hypothetical protein